MISGTIPIEIIALDLNSMSISFSINPITAYFSFDVAVKLFDQRSQLLTQSSLVDLNVESNFIGIKTKSTSTGTVIFSLYSTTSGSFIIQAVSSSTTISSAIIIYQLLIKVISVSKTVKII